MHELAVTEGILKVALAEAERANARAIIAIDLVIGDLSSVVDESVQFYFDFLSQGTLAADARLTFRREPAMAHCLACGFSEPATTPLTPLCTRCHAQRVQISGGRDFRVESIEIEES